MRSTYRILGRPCLLALLLIPGLALADPKSEGIQGRWLAPAHGSDKPAARVAVKVAGDRLSGRIDSLIGRPPDSRCGKCRGDDKGRSVVGMEILRGFVFVDGAWKGGHILDPESGRVFRAEIAATADGKRLKVRGYLGWKWIGMDVYWIRADQQP